MRRLFVPVAQLTAAVVFSLVLVGSAAGATRGDAAAQATAFTVAAWGGDTQKHMNTAFLNGFAKTHKVRAINDQADYAKYKAMVQAKHVTWDAVDVDGFFADNACRDGTATPLPASVLALAKKVGLNKSAYGKCWVTPWAFSFVLAYRTDKVSSPPTKWADFYDTTTYPGGRAVQSWLPSGQLESAVRAAGVARSNVYPLNLTKAFAQLSKIKGDLVYATSGQDVIQQLASGEATMAIATPSRVLVAIKQGVPLRLIWSEQVVAGDAWIVPKGAPNPELSWAWLEHLLQAQNLVNFAKLSTYGPNTKQAQAVLAKNPALCNTTNTCPKYGKTAIPVNDAWYAKYMDVANARWKKLSGG